MISKYNDNDYGTKNENISRTQFLFKSSVMTENNNQRKLVQESSYVVHLQNKYKFLYLLFFYFLFFSMNKPNMSIAEIRWKDIKICKFKEFLTVRVIVIVLS